MKLVIVESPTKAKTISKFLGPDFIVESSYGHVRDLPKGEMGVDVAHDFEPKYVIPLKSRKVVSKLKKTAKQAEQIIFATDEDREGEAISWHLSQILDLTEIKNIERIVFHEITKEAIEEALKNPRGINGNLVDAQQARRILDRLVGYELSPFLWKKVAKGLSAGRVQSVAVRLIVERELEIQAFKPQEYWSVEAKFQSAEIRSPAEVESPKIEFSAKLYKINDKALDKFTFKNQQDVDPIVQDLRGATFKVKSVTSKETKRAPYPPFTTASLQQEANRRLYFSAKKTMVVAQQLYENGHITYMRTDSVNLAERFLQEARSFISGSFSAKYLPEAPRRFATKSKLAQEAHEAIRPTEVSRTPESVQAALQEDQLKLYTLIWQRAVACQMRESVLDAAAADITALRYTFRATGQVVKFDGFLKVYPMRISEVILPKLTENEEVALKELKPEEHSTEPPARFSDASLVETLEKYGIGRPSTYAPTIGTIIERGYIERIEGRRLKPKEIAFLVNEVLTKHFPEIVDFTFTARLEDDLDAIAQGKKQWVPLLQAFYTPFKEQLDKKYKEVSKKELIDEKSDEICDKCGSPMVVKLGRYGKFLGCSAFPKCRNIKSLKTKETPVALGPCLKCKEGNIVEKRTKKGRRFWGCSRWPACDFASWTRPQEQDNTRAK